MFWISIMLFVALVTIFILTYIIDPSTVKIIKEVKDIDPTPIKTFSEYYLDFLKVKIKDIPITYRFVEYRETDKTLLGTFHKWNNTYYMDINSDLISDEDKLKSTIMHETRHMVVAYLKDKKIIDLEEYTEEIAQHINIYYDNLFNSGIYLYNTNGPDHKVLIQR